MVTQRIIDLDAKETEWKSQISNLKEKVEEYDKNIQEIEISKRKATEEIEKYERWMKTAREMYGISEEGSIDLPTEPKMRRGIQGSSLREAIQIILKENAQGLTTRETEDILIDSGFKSDAQDFRSVVFTTLYNLKRQGFIEVEKKGKKNIYKLKKEKLSRIEES